MSGINITIKRGHLNGRWTPDEASYYATHNWIRRHYGRANKCEFCNSQTANNFHWANVSGQYKRDISDFIMLCVPCHKKFDKGNLCVRGHEFTPENTRTTKEGWRRCRACHRINQNNYTNRQKNKS